MSLLVRHLVAPTLIVSVDQMIDGRAIANENIIFLLDIIVQIVTLIPVDKINLATIEHRLQLGRLVILKEQIGKQKKRKKLCKFNMLEQSLEKSGASLTLVMAYSMQLPRCATNSLSLLMRSSIFLIGNVNFDRVRNAVKLAV